MVIVITAPIEVILLQVDINNKLYKPYYFLGYLEKYNSKDKTKYPFFKGFLKAKLLINKLAISKEIK